MNKKISKNHWQFIDGKWVADYNHFVKKMSGKIRCPHCRCDLNTGKFEVANSKFEVGYFAYQDSCDEIFYLTDPSS
jgi:hypothetical protein